MKAIVTFIRALAVLVLLTSNLFALLKPEITVIKTGKDQITFEWKDFNTTYDRVIVLKESALKSAPPKDLTSYTPNFDLKTKNSKSFTGAGNLLIFSGKALTGKIELKNLDPGTDYDLNFYYFSKKSHGIENRVNPVSLSVSTTPEKPKVQASKLRFGYDNSDQLHGACVKGDGKKRLVLASINKITVSPTDGKDYKAGNPGECDSLATGVYVIYSGKDVNFNISGLKGNTVWNFRVIEFNGTGKNAIYLEKDSKTNIASRKTLLDPPTALAAEIINETSFKAKWTKVNGGLIYLIDVAFDKNFKSMVEDLSDVDVGDIDAYPVSDIAAGKTYYYRVRSRAKGNWSPNSNVIEVKMK